MTNPKSEKFLSDRKTETQVYCENCHLSISAYDDYCKYCGRENKRKVYQSLKVN